MITLYCSPNQNQGEFEHFLLSLENLLGNIRNQDPSLTILLGEFNDRSKIWWVHDITNNEDTQIESISLLYGFSQLISEQTYILQNASSCLDLVFTDQTNLVINSGVKSSLHENCYQQITYPKFNLPIMYPHLTKGHIFNILKLCDKSLVELPSKLQIEKDLMKNYRSVPLSRTFGNFFERLIFNSLFKYIDESELPNRNQSGFRPFSFIYKPTSIYKL